MSVKAVVWGQDNCQYCTLAKRLLEDNGIPYEYRLLKTMDDKAEFFELTRGARTVPQIFINDEHIGGFTELRKYLNDSI